jgi:hypothetical protein
MTGTPWSPPDELAVTMGEGEYAGDPNDERVRRVGTPLRDAAHIDHESPRFEPPLTPEQVDALPSAVRRVVLSESTDLAGHWQFVDPITGARSVRAMAWPVPALAVLHGQTFVLVPPAAANPTDQK